MRIHISTTKNTSSVPFNYQQKLVGTIHKWIGENSIHDKISLYSFSWLQGGRKVSDALDFPEGATMFLSFYDDDTMRKVIKTILENPLMFCGMSVTSIDIDDTPSLENRELFYCASPIFIKRKMEDGSIKQFTYNDEQAGLLLKETLKAKMKEAGLPEDNTLDIQFDLSYEKKKFKLISYRGIGNKANLCPVVIKAKTETKLFAWHVGIGNCTGIGFGAIY